MAQVHHLHAQAAGLVAPHTRPNGALLPVFKYSGTTNLCAKLGRKFERELSELLATAGFGGTFKITVQTLVKGSRHTEGLCIGLPNERFKAAELTWQGGDNGSRVSMQLHAPHIMGTLEFHRVLKMAQGALAQQEESHKAPAQPAVQSAPQEPAAAIEPSPPEAKPETKAEAKAKSRGFAEDPQLVELFVERVVSQASAHGLVSKRMCCDVIQKFGITAGGVGQVFHALVKHGHLVDRSGGVYAVGGPWAGKFGLAEPPFAKPEQPQAAPDAASSSSGVDEAYRRLLQKLASAPSLRAKLDELREQCAELKRQHETAANEYKAVKADLDSLADDERKLALIKETLGIS